MTNAANVIIDVIGISIIALLPIVSPFSAVPIFLSLTQGMIASRQRKQASMERGCMPSLYL